MDCCMFRKSSSEVTRPLIRSVVKETFSLKDTPFDPVGNGRSYGWATPKMLGQPPTHVLGS